MEVSAEIVLDVAPPALGKANLLVNLTIWTGDNPTLDELRKRVLEAVGNAVSPAP